jgi:hypothetical protein
VWGKCHPVGPNKLHSTVEKSDGSLGKWIDEVHLERDCIHGPFKFAPPTKAKNRSDTVSRVDWDALEEKAAAMGIDASNIHHASCQLWRSDQRNNPNCHEKTDVAHTRGVALSDRRQAKWLSCGRALSVVQKILTFRSNKCTLIAERCTVEIHTKRVFQLPDK